MRPPDAVLLIGFGGPTAREEIRPFLNNLLRGRRVPPQRVEQVVHHYEMIGGKSPFNELTMAQADALREELRRRGLEVPVFVGMRNWDPYIAEAIREIAAGGYRRVCAFILSVLRCEASWERYQESVSQALAALPEPGPEVLYTVAWHDHPLFIEAMAARVIQALMALPEPDRGQAELIFTAHSIPQAMAQASTYVGQLEQASRLVARRVGCPRWSIAYQSRSGAPGDSWLEPDIGQVLSASRGTVIVVPIGFVCDHVEVLYDLDIEAAAIARQAGVAMLRARAVGDHPAFIRMAAELVLGNGV